MANVTNEDRARARRAYQECGLDPRGWYTEAETEEFIEGMVKYFTEAREAGVAEGRRLEQERWERAVNEIWRNGDKGPYGKQGYTVGAFLVAQLATGGIPTVAAEAWAIRRAEELEALRIGEAPTSPIEPLQRD